MKSRWVVFFYVTLCLASLLIASSTSAAPSSLCPSSESITPTPTAQTPVTSAAPAAAPGCVPSDDSGLVSPFDTIQPNANGEARIIIQMQGEPVGKYRSASRAAGEQAPEDGAADLLAYAGRLTAEHNRFLAEVRQRDLAIETHRSYSFAFNGLAATVRAADVAILRSLPDVKGIFPDRPVEADLTESVPLIGADQVWTMTDAGGHPVTGLGIRVAIIDTGIDYTHPDLGGCFGAACRVVGGYDYVNDDADPRDDNGHGTHVAGIVGANGVMKGVAPDVSFYAYKVLGSSGTGLMSDVIAALDAAVDPDGDPLTVDAVDVANLSLGGAGGPDDPVSQAVDAAVDQGVAVVASAGNGGPGISTLVAPGVARKALSVAATSKTDALADFSSRGPVPDHYDLIKPDISAPGVTINAPYMGASYISLSGTSAAAPHVAGVATLLKQLHTDWNPETIKANLMNTALGLGLSAFKTGAGRVQAANAAHAPAVLVPGSLGLGMVDVSQPTWSETRELRLTSLTSTPVEYSLGVSGSLPAGVTVSVTPGTAILGAGEFVSVTFNIVVDTATLPYPTTDTGFYEASIVAQSAAGSLSVPVAFSKGARLEVTLDENPYDVILLAPEDTSGTLWWLKFNPGLMATFQVPPRTYDLWVGFDRPPVCGTFAGRTWVIREGVEVSDVTRLTIRRSDASHTIALNPQDKNGQPISPTNALISWQFKNVVYPWHGLNGWSSNIFVPGAVLHFSDFSPNYSLDWRLDLASSGDWYEFNDHLDGLTTDVTYQNDPAVFRHLTYHFDMGSSQPDLMVSHAVSIGPYF